jgi:hypothetical protein
MQIILTDLSGVLSPITLGDDAAGAFIIDPPPIPAEKRQVQTEQLALSPRIFANGVGNRATSFSWTVARVHATQGAADTFVWTHAASIPLNASIVLNDPDGAEVASFTSAVVSEVTCTEQSGISTKFRYAVEGAVPS